MLQKLITITCILALATGSSCSDSKPDTPMSPLERLHRRLGGDDDQKPLLDKTIDSKTSIRRRLDCEFMEFLGVFGLWVGSGGCGYSAYLSILAGNTGWAVVGIVGGVILAIMGFAAC